MSIKLPQIFSDRRFKTAAIVAAAVVLILVVLNLFVVGGDLFIQKFNNGASLPFALVNLIAAASIWSKMSSNTQNRAMWTGLITGWALWTLAETIWAIYTFLDLDPYPSPADFFWVLGYIPMGIGLIIRARTMPTKPTRSQYVYILSVTAFTFLITLLAILIPIIQEFQWHRALESLLSLAYPLLDLALISILWRLFFTYEEGDYGFSWRLLTLGFMCMTLSDLFFTYAAWQEIYYPDNVANLFSRVTDVSYLIAYLLWIVSVYALGILREEKSAPEPISKVRLVRTYGHILMYTKGDDTVLETSPNFGRFFENAEVTGKPFAEALTISAEDGRAIMNKIRAAGKVADLPIRVRNFSGAMQEMRVSGVAILNSQKGYMGCNLLLRMRVKDASFDNVLDQPSRAMAKYLLERSGSNTKSEIAQFLLDYYLAFIKMLFDMAAREGGVATAAALLDTLQATADRRNWDIKFDAKNILEHTDYPLDVLREALPELLETAKKFVANLTDPASVEERMAAISAQFNDTVKRDIKRYQEEGIEFTFADNARKAPPAIQ